MFNFSIFFHHKEKLMIINIIVINNITVKQRFSTFIYFSKLKNFMYTSLLIFNNNDENW